MKPLRHLFATSPLSAGARAIVVASLLIGGSWISGCAGNADMSGDSHPAHGEGVASLPMKGIALTPEQIDAINKASADNPHLSSKEARDVIGAARVGAADVSPRSSGSDSSTGDCSWIDLWGNSDGHYRFTQAVFPEVGEAATGDISISTDGWFAATSDHDLTLAGDYQHYEGNLSWTGVDAEATTMDGWMVTTEGNFCTGALDAVWE